jgi:tetratricopeptide (TPR) repeat protein
MSVPQIPSREDLVDAAIADWLEAAEIGQAPDSREFLARYPDLVEELAAFLADREHFDRRAARVAPTAGLQPPSAPAESAGRRLGDFEIICEIGRGGMGIVYEARQVSLKRPVALKVLNSGSYLDPRAVQRFRREAEAAAMLRHANIVPVFATGEEAGVYYYAMELVPGPSLDRVVRAASTGPGIAATASASLVPGNNKYFVTIAALLADAALALHHAHERGVVHRDVKPSNLLLAPGPRICVSDFGLARIVDEPGMTLTAEIIGSPAYMSPEQAAGRIPIDRRTDIYSLGVTLYEFLALRPPFAGTSRDAVLYKIIHDDPLPPRQWNPQAPYELETICLKAIEKDPSLRYQTAADLARDLANFAAGRSIAARRRGNLERAWSWSRRRPGTSALVAGLVAVVALAGYFAHSARSSRVELSHFQLEDLVDEALIANMSGDIEMADRAIARVAALEPNTGWLPLLRGHLAFQRGDYDEGVEHLQHAVELLPESVAARSLLAASYVGAGWWERYETVLEELEKLTPQSAEDYMFRGLAESYLDPARARALLDEAIRSRRLPAAFVIRAEVCAHQAMDTGQKADADAAVADAKLACDLLPNHPAALLERLFAHHVAAGVYDEAGRHDEAQALISLADGDAAALAPFTHLPSVARARAWFFLYTDREPQAFEILKQAVSQSENARVAYRYALLLYRRGDFDAGLSVLDRRSHRSNNEELLRVVLLMEQPDGRQRALEAYRTLSEQSPEGLAALFRPALLLLLGDKSQAVAENRQFRLQGAKRLPRLRLAFYEQLLAFNCGELEADGLLQATQKSKWDQCEANFFIGLAQLAEGNRDAAARHFRMAVATRCDGFLACDWSAAFLIRLKNDPRWPRWIP